MKHPPEDTGPGKNLVWPGTDLDNKWKRRTIATWVTYNSCHIDQKIRSNLNSHRDKDKPIEDRFSTHSDRLGITKNTWKSFIFLWPKFDHMFIKSFCYVKSRLFLVSQAECAVGWISLSIHRVNREGRGALYFEQFLLKHWILLYCNLLIFVL